jgi:hypothetical protein
MKIIAAAAASLMTLLPAQCQTAPQTKTAAAVQTSPLYQSAYGTAINVQPACAVFTITFTNSTTNSTARQATVFVDGQAREVLAVLPGHSKTRSIYFANNSGDYKITVGWPGGYSDYSMWTNCAP